MRKEIDASIDTLRSLGAEIVEVSLPHILHDTMAFVLVILKELVQILQRTVQVDLEKKHSDVLCWVLLYFRVVSMMLTIRKQQEFVSLFAMISRRHLKMLMLL